MVPSPGPLLGSRWFLPYTFLLWLGEQYSKRASLTGARPHGLQTLTRQDVRARVLEDAHMHWLLSTGRMSFAGAGICHSRVGTGEVTQDWRVAGLVCPGTFTLALGLLPGSGARSPRCVFLAPQSAPPTPQRQPATPTAVPSPRPSPSPSSRVFRSYDEQLRLAMELSAQEQEERRRRARQEEEELERILRLSLTEQ